MRTNWTNRIYRLEKKYGFFTAPIQADTWQQYVKDVRDRVQEKEEELWLQGMGGKSSMTLYGQHKRTIGAVFIYDNSRWKQPALRGASWGPAHLGTPVDYR
ncbi:hypothetical protein MTO96_047214 [Rhipicephalus appendiculatus]